MRNPYLTLLILFIGNGFVARCEIGVLDHVPAATLLLPYFEVDVNPDSGHTTRFTISNASDGAINTHVILLTNIGVATIGFNIHLAAHDQQEVDFKDIFNGATLFDPPTDFSAVAETLTRAHRGQPDTVTNLCSAMSDGVDYANGYVLINVVNEDTTLLPGDNGYFVNHGSGVASNANVIWGDFWIIEEANDRSFGEALVSIEASSSHPLVNGSDAFTFYGRYVSFNGADNREPLALSWAVPFSNGDGNGYTELIYWRDSMNLTSPLPCGFAPAWWPIREVQVDIHDGAGNVEPLTNWAPFPSECGRIQIGESSLPVPFDSGWLWLDLGIPDSLSDPSSQTFILSIDTENNHQTSAQAMPLEPLVHP